MIAFGDEGSSVISGSVRLAPGLGLTNRFIIDQHFRQRDRLGRLLTALAYNPFAVGIGLDEDTAAFIGPDETVEVEGSGGVTDRRCGGRDLLVDGQRHRGAAGVHARPAAARAGGGCHVQPAHAGRVGGVAGAREGVTSARVALVALFALTRWAAGLPVGRATCPGRREPIPGGSRATSVSRDARANRPTDRQPDAHRFALADAVAALRGRARHQTRCGQSAKGALREASCNADRAGVWRGRGPVGRASRRTDAAREPPGTALRRPGPQVPRPLQTAASNREAKLAPASPTRPPPRMPSSPDEQRSRVGEPRGDAHPRPLRLRRPVALRALSGHPPRARPGAARGVADGAARRRLHRRAGDGAARPGRARLLLRRARRLLPAHARGRGHLARPRARARRDRAAEHRRRERHLRQDARCRSARRVHGGLRIRAARRGHRGR